MAKLTGVWIYEVPRGPKDDVQLLGGATLIVTEADRRTLGDNFMRVRIKVMDDDSVSDDTLYDDNSFQLGPGLTQIGPNTFSFSANLPHSKVKDSEPSYENWAELYFRLRVSGGGVTTSWVNTENEAVRFD